jgi:hypothetical protein
LSTCGGRVRCWLIGGKRMMTFLFVVAARSQGG